MTRFFVLLAACALTTQAAHANWWDEDRIKGEGPVKEERREISSVDGVELATFGTLYIEQADSVSLTVVAQENLLDYFETDVRSGVLRIETKSRVQLQATEPVEYHLTVPHLEDLVLSSSGDVEMYEWKAEKLYVSLESSGDLECDSLVCPDLDVELESSGDLILHVWNGETLKARLSSSGDLKIYKGTADQVDVDVHSSGDFRAEGLECARARVTTNSSGDVYVHVTDSLRARASSSGDVVYFGDPDVDSRASSSGDIIRRRK